MNRKECVWWRGAVTQYRFVDEEHGERDAAEEGLAIDQACEVICHPAQYVDEEGEEE